MSWKKRAAGGKRDQAEKPILEALEAIGARTWQLSGQSNPDVLWLYRGRYGVFEVKTGKGRLTKNQQCIPWPVVNTPESAIAALLAEVGHVTPRT